MTWSKRKTKLGALLNSSGDEEEDGRALDRLLHGSTVIGQTSRTREIESLRFNDKDLDELGTLERGQFGTIHLVRCRLDGRVYVRKAIEKRFAIRTRDQCSPVTERTILLRALQSSTPWSPHLFCAFQTETHLNLVMDYAEGGSLQDLLDSSPLDSRVSESDLMWWAPQVISAIAWCHEQGFVHRDVKPNNFVLTSTANLLLIDFGSAAPLLPIRSDGSRRLAREHCLVPCGTCDYISPEILSAHERALVRLELEMDDETGVEKDGSVDDPEEEAGYGAETDWWSAGAMLYEMAFGVTPFFAETIKATYSRIMNFEMSLKFDDSLDVSSHLRDLIKRLLTSAERRLGRRGASDIKRHPLFAKVNWTGLQQRKRPDGLHVPQFAYDNSALANIEPELMEQDDTADSQQFAWSALFQTSSIAPINRSQSTSIIAPATPGLKSILRTPSSFGTTPRPSHDNSASLSSFIGFSWGPKIDIQVSPNTAGPSQPPVTTSVAPLALRDVLATPRRELRTPAKFATPAPFAFGATPRPSTLRKLRLGATPFAGTQAFATPARFGSSLDSPGTLGNTAKRRTVTERQAMREMLECVGMSARRTVIASGRKPRILASEIFRGMREKSASVASQLSFAEISQPSFGKKVLNAAGSSARKELRFGEALIYGDEQSRSRAESLSLSTSNTHELANGAAASETDTDTDAPPSPSPSPRPGSAMSHAGRRNMTPLALGSSFSNRTESDADDTNTGVQQSSLSDEEIIEKRYDDHSEEDEEPSAAQVFDDITPEDIADDLEMRYEKLLQDIGDLERRLRHISVY